MKPGEILKEVYKKRDPDSCKYDYGHLLVIGGSETYSGSPSFNSLAAYRSGVDLTTTASPKRSANIVATFSPSLITYPLEGKFLREKHLKELNKLKDKVDAVVIGGGLGRKEETLKAVRSFLKELKVPAVIDADGIHAVAEDKSVLSKKFLLTPHPKEFEVLTGFKPSEDIEERKEQLKRSSNDLESVLLLKGNTDLITDGEKVFGNKAGTPYLTTGGTGDILAGIAGALLSRGVKPLKAAYASAFINGKAGELAGKEKGEGLIPDDILEEISKVIEQFS